MEHEHGAPGEESEGDIAGVVADVLVLVQVLGFEVESGPGVPLAAQGEAAAIVVLALAVAYLVVGLAITFSGMRSGAAPDVDDASDLRW